MENFAHPLTTGQVVVLAIRVRIAFEAEVAHLAGFGSVGLLSIGLRSVAFNWFAFNSFSLLEVFAQIEMTIER